MRELSIAAALALSSAAFAQDVQTVPHAPFQGTYADGFESATPMQLFTCTTTALGDLCNTAGEDNIVSFNLISPFCTKYPFSGDQMFVAWGIPPSISIDFDEPMQRFGARFAHTGEFPALMEFRFSDASGRVVDVVETTIPACPWRWRGFQTLESEGWSSVEIISYGDDCAVIAMDDLSAESLGSGVDLGQSACPGVANSTGRAGRIGALGSDLASCSTLVVTADDLPTDVVGTFLMSASSTTVPFSDGRCLASPILSIPCSTQSTGAHGSMSVAFPTSDVPVLPGETWTFQAWHRDEAPRGVYTGAISVPFL